MPAPFVPQRFVDPKTGVLTLEARLFLEWFSDLLRGSPANRRIIWGTGTPEAAVTGSIGDLFVRTNGGAGSTFLVKESGTNTNTGWVGK